MRQKNMSRTMESIDLPPDSLIKVTTSSQLSSPIYSISNANVINTITIDPHVCGICGNSFRKEGTLRRHMQTHINEQHNTDDKTANKNYTCKVCYVNFVCPDQFREHVRTEHSVPQALKCTICGCFRPITEPPKFGSFKCTSCLQSSIMAPILTVANNQQATTSNVTYLIGHNTTSLADDKIKNKRISFVNIPQSYAVVQTLTSQPSIIQPTAIHAQIPSSQHIQSISALEHPLVTTIAVDDEIKFKIFVPKKEQITSTPLTTTSAVASTTASSLQQPKSTIIPTREVIKIRRSTSDSSGGGGGGTTQFKKTFKCTICDKAFSHYSTLAMHRKIHTGDYKYYCEFCQKPFFVADYYTRHRRVHTKEKPYKCDFCEKSFSQSNTLTQHRRIHTGEKPYGCTHCGKYFTVKDYLDKHIRTHTGEKPFACTICGKCYSQRSGLKTHSKTHYVSAVSA